MLPTPSRFHSLDLLRAVAVIGVCLLHLVCGDRGLFSRGSLMFQLGEWGRHGVDVFFVISGFVIPLALQRAGFEARDLPRFLLKRAVRLYPPYLLVAVGILLGGFIIAKIPNGLPHAFTPTWSQCLAHLVFLNDVLDLPWLNPVFWTLSIEFQYYLAIALAFPWLWSMKPSTLTVALVLTALLSLGFPSQIVLLHWLPQFVLGVLAFAWSQRRLSRVQLALAVAVASGVAWAVSGGVAAVASLATVLVMISGFEPGPVWRPCLWIGEHSYSIYLLHIPVGVRVLDLCRARPSWLPSPYLVLAAAMALVLIASWSLFRCVELPSQRWSSAIRYRRPPADGTAAG